MLLMSSWLRRFKERKISLPGGELPAMGPPNRRHSSILVQQ
jgi:hypothetical protein